MNKSLGQGGEAASLTHASAEQPARSWDSFYGQELRPKLLPLEAEREGVLRKCIMASLGIGLVALIAVGGALAFGAGFGLLAVIAVLGGLGCIGIWSLLSADYRLKFKVNIIGSIVKFFDSNLEYAPASGVSQSQFADSRIFKQHIDSYKFEDGVNGKLGKTSIAFSEVHAEYKTESTDSKGHSQEQWHTIFKGLFFIADFNKDFRGWTVVLPDVAERTLGKWLGQMIQGVAGVSGGELIKLEDPTFEKEFAVYSNDQVESRYILSPSLMERILRYKQSTGNQLYLSFVGSKICIAISLDRDLFEPSIWNSLLDPKLCRGYVNDMETALRIVEDLNLNTRIWTKE